jgi:hypothetical protein
MPRFSSTSTSFRALLPAVAVVALGAAAFAAGRESQRASMATPLTICSTETEAAFPAETPYLAENDAHEQDDRGGARRETRPDRADAVEIASAARCAGGV